MEGSQLIAAKIHNSSKRLDSNYIALDLSRASMVPADTALSLCAISLKGLSLRFLMCTTKSLQAKGNWFGGQSRWLKFGKGLRWNQILPSPGLHILEMGTWRQAGVVPVSWEHFSLFIHLLHLWGARAAYTILLSILFAQQPCMVK